LEVESLPRRRPDPTPQTLIALRPANNRMQTLHVTDERALTVAAATLRAGEVIVVPTDTVYGLAALPDDADAVRRIYLAKERPDQMQLPVLAATIDQVRQLGVEFPREAAALSSRWWPGPLTMAFGFSARAARPPWLDDREEVAVRIPDNAFLLALMRTTGALVVTSANRHGAMTPPAAEEAGSLLAPHVSLAIDGGPLDSIPSTLVNVRARPPVVEREGAIARSDVAAALEGAA
jgi:L-threonylcarbamoyladenylate synthase